jgi:transcriptional regulator with XRE-family HTH domain
MKKKLGEALRIYRKQQGYTQQELAEKLFVVPEYISLVENGKNTPSVHLLLRWFKALQIEIELNCEITRTKRITIDE